MAFAVRNARDVRDGLGFNVGGRNGIEITATATDVAKALEYVGARWLRTEINGAEVTYGKNVQDALVAQKYNNPNLKCQLLVNGYLAFASTYPWSAKQSGMVLGYISDWQGQDGKSIIRAVEGPNEMNSNDFQGGHTAGGEQCCIVDTTNAIQSYSGTAIGSQPDSNSDAAMIQWTAKMASTLQPTLKNNGIELLSPTYSGYYFVPWQGNQNVSAYADRGCYHSYNNSTGQTGGNAGSGMPCSAYAHANNPGVDMSQFYQSAALGLMGDAKASMVISETRASMASSGPFTAASSARSDMCWFFDFMVLGGKRMMYFDLLEDTTNAGGGWGFLQADFVTPYPIAICMKNTMNILSLKKSYQSSDNNNDTASFTPKFNGSTLTVSTPTAPSGAGASISTFPNINVVQPGVLVMPKSDGSTIIAVWNEPSVQTSSGSGGQVIPSAASCTVNFGSTQTYNVYDITGQGGNTSAMSPNVTTTPYIANASGSSVTVNLYGMPVLIELVAAVATTVPAAPSGFTLGTTTSTRQTVTFTAGSTGQANSPDNFILQYQKGGTTGTWITQATITASNTSYTYYGLDISSLYYFRMFASNSIGQSASPTSNLSATTLGQQTSSTPGLIQTATARDDGTNVTSHTLSLGSVPQTGNSVYVFFNGYGGTGGVSNSITAPSGSTVVSGPNYNSQEVTWCWKMPASAVTSNSFTFSNFDSGNNAGWKLAEVSNATTESADQGAVSSVTATAITWPLVTPSSSNCVRLSLLSMQQKVTTVGSGSTGVTVQRADTSAAFHVGILASETASTTSPVNIALTGATASDPDAYLNLTIYGKSLPNQVANLSYTNLTSTTLTLSWTSQGANVTSYRVEQSTDSGTTWTKLVDVTASTSSYAVTGLTSNTGYQFRVTAYNDSGTGSPSTAVSLTTSTAPAIQVIQSAIGTDQTGSSSVTATFQTAPTVGNTLVFYFVTKKTGNTGLTPGIPASAAAHTITIGTDNNADSAHMFWTQTVTSTTGTGFTYTGYVDLATLCVVEVQGVVSIDTPTHQATLTYSDGASGSITLPVTAPSTTSQPSLGLYFIGVDVPPLSWGTMPSNITLLRSTVSTSASAVSFHGAAALQVASSVTAGDKSIPMNSTGITQGAAPMMAGVNLIGQTSTAVPPGSTTLTFGTATTTTQPLSWTAASNATSYQIKYSTNSNMT